MKNMIIACTLLILSCGLWAFFRNAESGVGFAIFVMAITSAIVASGWIAHEVFKISERL